MRIVHSIVVVLVAIASVPSAARAQQPVRTFDELTAAVSKGQRIAVRDQDDAGSVIKGTLSAISASGVKFTTKDGLKQLPRDRIAALGIVKSRMNLIGPVVGGAAGVLAVKLTGALFKDCGECVYAPPLWFYVACAAGGAALGAKITPKHDVTKWIYSRPGPTASIAPIVFKGRRGVNVTIRF